VFGPDTIHQVEADPGHLTLHTKWAGPATAEFLPALPPGRYRVRAELRHDRGDHLTKVGLYVAGQRWESAVGQHMHCATLYYEDAGPDLVPRAAPATNSKALFGALLTGEVRTVPSHWRIQKDDGVHSVGFLSAADGRPPFRTLELRVAGTGVEATWDHRPVGWMPQAFAATSLADARADYPPTEAPNPGVGPLGGGVGVFVYNGTLSIRDLRIVPEVE
jgi:hypothetical protein